MECIAEYVDTAIATGGYEKAIGNYQLQIEADNLVNINLRFRMIFELEMGYSDEESVF